MPPVTYKQYLLLFLSSAFVSYIFTPLVKRAALRLNVVDRPGVRKIHDRSIPLLGGLGIFVTFGLLMGCCVLSEGTVSAMFIEEGRYIFGILLCGLVALLLGVYDDARGANAPKKFSVQIGAAILAFALGFRVEGISLEPWGSVELGVFSLPFTVLWIVGITNAINLIDGMDGLASGVTLFVCIGNFFVSLALGNLPMSLLSVILAGALVGFLRYNFPPATIFLGNTGSLFLGMVVALVSILSAQKSSTMVMMLIPIAVLGLPILDTFLAVFRRSLLGRPIFVSDKGHIHHALLRLGLSHRTAVLTLYIFCMFLLGFAVMVLLNKSAIAVIYLGVIAVVLVVGMKVLGYLDYEKLRRALSNRWRYRVKNAFCRLMLLKIRNVESVNELWKLLVEAAAEFEVDDVELSLNGGVGDSVRRWANGINHETGDSVLSNEWRTQRYDFSGHLGSLTLSYCGSGDEDFEVERNYRLDLIGQAIERRLSELVSVSGAQA